MPFKLLPELFNIKDSTDRDNTIRQISINVTLKGYNLWILACSAILASIGLDTNSVAVIIGAMLISPLMSPILGVGLSLGTNDRELLFRSFRNLAIAAGMGLAASFLYFLLTPLGEPTSEILARIRPTLLDVLVALFGGIAGIVSISREDKTNAIPGVAIATALMPPLCTAGFGLATGDIRIFLGAFYLFFINAVFISLSTYIIVKYLEFPLKSYIDKSLQVRVRKIMAFLLLLVIAPSIYFLFTTYQENREKKKIKTLIISDLENKDNEILKWEIERSDSISMVKVYFSGKEIPADTVARYNSALAESELDEYRVKLFRVNLSRDEIVHLSSQATKDVIRELEMQAARTNEAEAIVNDSLQEAIKLRKIFRELSVIFPQVKEVSIGEVSYFVSDTMMYLTSTIVGVKKGTQSKEIENMKLSISQLMKIKLDKDSVVVLITEDN